MSPEIAWRPAAGAVLALLSTGALGSCSGDLRQTASVIQRVARPRTEAIAPARAPQQVAVLRTPTPVIPTPTIRIITPVPVVPTPTPLAQTMPDAPGRPPSMKPDVTFVIRLPRLEDMEELGRRPGIPQVVEAASRYPEAQIYLSAYVTPDDARARHADANALADQIVIDTARHLADSGVDPKRISGKGAGIDKTVGRAIVVSLDVGPLPATPPEPSESPSTPTSRYGHIHPIGTQRLPN